MIFSLWDQKLDLVLIYLTYRIDGVNELTEQIFTWLKSTLETTEKGVKYVQSQWRCSSVSIVNFEHISHLFLKFLLLTLNK